MMREIREIRFRAWDNRLSLMVVTGDSWLPANHGTSSNCYPVRVNSNGITYCKKADFSSDLTVLVDGVSYYSRWEGGDLCTASIILMQFTGLTDKNCVDIYEGDIVDDHNGKGIVEYVERHAAFRVNYKGNNQAKWFYDYNLKGEMESIEVVGNIYEH